MSSTCSRSFSGTGTFSFTRTLRGGNTSQRSSERFLYFAAHVPFMEYASHTVRTVHDFVNCTQNVGFR